MITNLYQNWYVYLSSGIWVFYDALMQLKSMWTKIEFLFLLGILHLKKKQEKHGRKNALKQDYNVVAENLPKLVTNPGYPGYP